MVAIASSIHEIKVELNKLNTKKITMTLDCCRNVSRGADQAEPVVVDLRYMCITSKMSRKVLFVKF